MVLGGIDFQVSVMFLEGTDFHMSVMFLEWTDLHTSVMFLAGTDLHTSVMFLAGTDLHTSVMFLAGTDFHTSVMFLSGMDQKTSVMHGPWSGRSNLSTARPAQQGGPGGPWPTQLSGQVGFFFLPLDRDIEHRGYTERSVDRHSHSYS